MEGRSYASHGPVLTTVSDDVPGSSPRSLYVLGLGDVYWTGGRTGQVQVRPCLPLVPLGRRDRHPGPIRSICPPGIPRRRRSRVGTSNPVPSDSTHQGSTPRKPEKNRLCVSLYKIIILIVLSLFLIRIWGSPRDVSVRDVGTRPREGLGAPVGPHPHWSPDSHLVVAPTPRLRPSRAR